MPATTLSFEGIRDGFPGFKVPGDPSDSNGAVGPNHYVQKEKARQPAALSCCDGFRAKGLATPAVSVNCNRSTLEVGYPFMWA